MRLTRRTLIQMLGPAVLGLSAGATGRAQSTDPGNISPAELAAWLKKAPAERPLVLHVGFKVMYDQAHIPGSEYAGPGADDKGLAALRTRLAGVKKDAPVVIYCGCCPWDRCPNMKPAAALLKQEGFTRARSLVIPDNFGADWVAKGYPTEKGR